MHPMRVREGRVEGGKGRSYAFVNRTRSAGANGAAAKRPWFQNQRDPPLALSDLLDAYCCLGVVSMICFLARIELSRSPLSTLRL